MSLFSKLFESVFSKHSKSSIGGVKLAAPADDVFERLARFWPAPVKRIRTEVTPTICRMEHEVPFDAVRNISMAQGWFPLEIAIGIAQVNRIRIARGLGDLARTGYTGLLVPAAKVMASGDTSQSGIEFFVFPDPNGPESRLEPNPFADDLLGTGATELVVASLKGLKAQMAGIPPFVPTHEFLPYSKSDASVRWVDFFVFEGKVYSAKLNYSKDDPTWAALAQGGVREVSAFPIAGAWPTKLARAA